MNETTSLKPGRKRSQSRLAAPSDFPLLFRSRDTAGPANDLVDGRRIDTLPEQLAEAKALLAAAYQKLILYRKELASALAENDRLQDWLREAEEREEEMQAELEEAQQQIAAYAESAAFAQRLLASCDEKLLRRRWWEKLLRL